MITRRAIFSAIVVLLLSCFGFAQEPGMGYGRGTGNHAGRYGAMTAAPPARLIPGLNFSGLNGQWWKSAEVVKKLGLSDAQVQQIEQIFQEHRLKLIDLHAALQREEVRMEPMLRADNPNESQVLAQIDKVAAQRANLEKENAQMAFAIRRVLNPEQWKTLQSLRQERAKDFRDSPRKGGQGRWRIAPAAPAPQQ
jgi:Spy/CpxP family protein refolding chaperone